MHYSEMPCIIPYWIKVIIVPTYTLMLSPRRSWQASSLLSTSRMDYWKWEISDKREVSEFRLWKYVDTYGNVLSKKKKLLKTLMKMCLDMQMA